MVTWSTEFSRLAFCVTINRAVVLAGFFAYVTMFGVANIYGLFSQAYATSILEGKSTTLELMTIGSVLFVSLNVLSPISVLLVRFGTRFNYALGSVLACLGVILASFTTEVWHLYLTQGLLFGFGSSFLYMVNFTYIPISLIYLTLVYYFVHTYKKLIIIMYSLYSMK